MRPKRAGLTLVVLATVLISAFTCRSDAQTTAYTEKFLINAASASTWSQDGANVLQLSGGVSITLDDVQCSAENAVIWLTPAK